MKREVNQEIVSSVSRGQHIVYHFSAFTDNT